MKLLLDNNLSPRLVRRLSALYPESAHVRAFNLQAANDEAVWEHARHLASTSFSRDVGAKCSRCEASKRTAFPLAPKEAIFEVLGYV